MALSDITIAGMVYRSPAHYHSLQEEMLRAAEDCPEIKCALILANCPESDLRPHLETPCVPTVVRYENHDDWYLSRVYRGWNHLLRSVSTKRVVLMNSDMIGTKGWVARLAAHHNGAGHAVCSRIIQRRKPGEGMIEADFGAIPHVDRRALEDFAATAAQAIVKQGGYYQPVLAVVDDLLRFGGYPEGNVNKEGQVVQEPARGAAGIVGGDRYHFNRIGIKHETAWDSLVYHEWEGERRCG